MSQVSRVPALVLCAGFGTRLLPLTEETPKALVPVGDRPQLEHLILRLRAFGFEQVMVNAHSHEQQLVSYCARLNGKIQVLREPRILGTAGGVRNATRSLGQGPMLVWNGDILANPPIAELLEVASRGHVALAIAPRQVKTGSVGLDSRGAVVRIRAEVFGAEVVGGDFIGVSAWPAAVAKGLPEEGCLVGDAILPALRSGRRIRTVSYRGEWTDIGTLGGYLHANYRWLAERNVDRWVHGEARVGGAVSLSGSIVGRRAVVQGAGSLERCLVWPDAVARAPLADCIVTPTRLLRLSDPSSATQTPG